MEYENPGFLTTVQALKGRLDDPNLRVLDCTVFLVRAETGYRAESGRAKYDEAHIPGALFMDQVEAFSDTSSGLNFTNPGAPALATALAALGVGNEHDVVLYSTGSVMWATRAWWLLRHAGHDRVSVLDGGLARWQANGFDLSDETPDVPPATFTAQSRPEMFVGRAEVLDAVGAAGTCTVNALSPAVYEGSGERHYGRRGHIPGSINVFYDELLDDGCFRSADEINRLLSARGLLAANRVIAYCGGGISATIDAFACQLLGKDGVSVYDGSMSEWVSDESLPLVTGSDPG